MVKEIWLIALFLLFSEMIIRVFNTKLFNFLDKYEKNRKNNLDGLRFVLAIGVLFHHSIVLYSAFHSPTFDFVTQGYPILWRVGRYAVATFFMISAYLFADRIDNTLVGIVNFAKNRLFRILPIAYISVIMCYMVSKGLGYGMGPHQSLRHIETWWDAAVAPFAAYTGNLQILLAPSVGVLWTLSFEWGLYLALPAVTALRRLVGRTVVSLVGTLAFAIAMPQYIDGNYRFIFCFLLGLLARDLEKYVNFGSKTKSIIAVVCVITALLTRNDPISVPNLMGLFLAFLMIVSGGNIFGLLERKGVVRLGEVSYGIYLTHGPFLFMLTYVVSTKISNKTLYCLSIFPVALFVCLLAAFFFRAIERPMIAYGKKLDLKSVI